MSDTHGKFIWVELMTPDMEAAARFYGHAIGWQTKDFVRRKCPISCWKPTAKAWAASWS